MKIEISDLPIGSKVKHINVDITFEEDNVQVKSTSTKQTSEVPIVYNSDNVKKPDIVEPIENAVNCDIAPIDNNDISMPAKQEKRVAKPIPSEMIEEEF